MRSYLRSGSIAGGACLRALILAGAAVLAGGCRPTAPPPGGSATLCWVAPERNADGTPLEDLAGYRLYWGRSPGGPYPYSAEISDPAQTTYTIEGLEDGDWYFVTQAETEEGVTSEFSVELEQTIVDGGHVSCCCD